MARRAPRPIARRRPGSRPAKTPGLAVFNSAGCGGCHTFTPAKSSGTTGPSLDDLTQDYTRAKRDGQDRGRRSRGTSSGSRSSTRTPTSPRATRPTSCHELRHEPERDADRRLSSTTWRRGARAHERRSPLLPARTRRPTAIRAEAQRPGPRPGWWRALLWTILASVLGIASPALIRVILGWPWYQYETMSDRAADRAAGLPARHRLLRLLGQLHGRLADEPEDHSDARRLQLARLLQGQHRPQGDRHPVPGHDVHLLPDRRPARGGLPRRAGPRRQTRTSRTSRTTA